MHAIHLGMHLGRHLGRLFVLSKELLQLYKTCSEHPAVMTVIGNA